MSNLIVSTFPPEVYHCQQAAGSNYYPVFQGGHGFRSLLKAAKSIALSFMKNVVLPVMEDETGQLIYHVASGKGIKIKQNYLMQNLTLENWHSGI